MKSTNIIYKPIFIISIIVLFLASTSAFSIILFLINKKILFNTKDIDLLKLIFQTSFTLMGSTLSGLVALLVFSLQFRNQKKEKDEKQEKYYNLIENEYQLNLKEVNDLYESLQIFTTSEIATILISANNNGEKTTEVKELLNIFISKMEFTIFDSKKDEISFENYINNINRWRRIKRIATYLNKCTNELTQKDNIETLIELSFREIRELLSHRN
ncbi:hypothetical protein [Neobacillus sp. LXY-4]|uniref:hypothetical protein n=1 Tax=Neobacillus sp. LXY-4 TaxID=3379826 RepID=UPI003EE04753